MRSSSSRGQTAIEMLFILGIMLTGLVVVISSVPSTSQNTILVYAMRNAASDVCSYLSTGVLVNDTIHDPLNDLIVRANYSPIKCSFLGLKVEKSEIGYKVVLKFSYSGPLGKTFTSDVERFVTLKASKYSGFSVSNGTLLFDGSPVQIEVVII